MSDKVVGSIIVSKRSRNVYKRPDGGLYTKHRGTKIALSQSQKDQLKGKKPVKVVGKKRSRSRSRSRSRRTHSRSRSRSGYRHKGYKTLGDGKRYRGMPQLRADLRVSGASPKQITPNALSQRGMLADLKKKAYFHGPMGPRAKSPGTLPIKKWDSFKVKYAFRPRGPKGPVKKVSGFL